MFGINDKKVNDLNKIIKDLENELKDSKRSAKWNEEKIRKMENEKEDLEKTHESEVRIKDSELKMKIDEALLVKTMENNELKMENGCQKREVEILKKAFENLGFDVKDMKNILNKLVDGIVSKNTIQLVK